MVSVRACLVSAIALGLSSSLGWAQSQAPATVETVVAACQSDDDLCIDAVRSYLADLRSSGVTGEAYDEQLADLVIGLVEDFQPGGCNGNQAVTASAISEAATFSTSPGQRAQVEEIALAVNRCLPQIATAVLATITPASAG